ncbi:MAG: tyrosine-protein phosphatase [Deltaproteobacteria bacterium]|nr:tyrosine-protein phosphatase [Deltaproteobacteria bacterium]MBW2447527.1 tyrosine-protein phosphatase [Deltaproteobacteria bacterium]
MRTPIRADVRAALAVLFAAALLAACAGNSNPVWEDIAPVSRPEVDATEDDSLRIRWPASFTLGSVEVFTGPSPDEIDRSKPVGRARALFTKVTVPRPDATERPYFELLADGGKKSRIVAERRLPLAGTDNFRDIGGYETEDQHIVRWGLLYRSNNLADLSADDLRYLNRLGVKLVCDFRSEPERLRDPNRAPANASTEELTIAVEGVDPAALQERIRTGVRADQLELIMLNAYRAFVTHHSDQFATMFERILEQDNLPTIVHCTAGKDRTGFASAMILTALGVPEKTVYEDYMATNRYRADYKKWIMRLVPIYSLFRTRGEAMAPLLDARRPYLEASFETIEAHYGSVDVYLEQRLGLTPAKREHLRQIFLR